MSHATAAKFFREMMAEVVGIAFPAKGGAFRLAWVEPLVGFSNAERSVFKIHLPPNPWVYRVSCSPTRPLPLKTGGQLLSGRLPEAVARYMGDEADEVISVSAIEATRRRAFFTAYGDARMYIAVTESRENVK